MQCWINLLPNPVLEKNVGFSAKLCLTYSIGPISIRKKIIQRDKRVIQRENMSSNAKTKKKALTNAKEPVIQRENVLYNSKDVLSNSKTVNRRENISSNAKMEKSVNQRERTCLIQRENVLSKNRTQKV